jgi:hypothetical protein
VLVAFLWLFAHYVKTQDIPMGQTVTRNINLGDLLVSDPLTAPFRIDYFAYTNTSNSSLDILVVEKQQFENFQEKGIEPVYVQGLSSLAVASAQVRGIFYILTDELSSLYRLFLSLFICISLSLDTEFFVVVKVTTTVTKSVGS